MRSQKIARLVMTSCLLLCPAAVWAQSSIAGLVRDTSGGVLPGVSVEATSPALIEGSKVAVTDSQGLYRIVDLRPGPYTVTWRRSLAPDVTQVLFGRSVRVGAQFDF